MEAWTQNENIILTQYVQTIGCQWSLIKKQLPNRSVASIRNRWQRIQKGKINKNLKNKCKTCGRFRSGHICLQNRPTEIIPFPLTDVNASVDIQNHLKYDIIKIKVKHIDYVQPFMNFEEIEEIQYSTKSRENTIKLSNLNFNSMIDSFY